MMIPANIGINTQTRLRKKPISTLLRYAKTSVRPYTIARSRMSWVIATAKMRTTIETSFTRGSRLCSSPLRWAMLSFTRHSSKNVKMSEIAFWTKPFFLPMLTVQQAQGPASIFCIHSGIIGFPVRQRPNLSQKIGTYQGA